MRIFWSPQRIDRVVMYTFDGEVIIAAMDGASDTFDFSSLPEGHTVSRDQITTHLDPCPVLEAKRVDGDLHVTLLRAIGPRPSDPKALEDWKRLWADIEEVV